jgi:hypothetical protein
MFFTKSKRPVERKIEEYNFKNVVSEKVWWKMLMLITTDGYHLASLSSEYCC